MKGEKAHTKQQPRKPTPNNDADDIEDPLSMPKVGENSSYSDDDVIITNTTRGNNDAISKFTKFKRKPQPSSGNLITKKSKVTPIDQTVDKEIEDDGPQKVTMQESKTSTTTPTHKLPKKKVSAASILDDDDDDVLNFTALEGVCTLLPLSLYSLYHLPCPTSCILLDLQSKRKRYS